MTAIPRCWHSRGARWRGQHHPSPLCISHATYAFGCLSMVDLEGVFCACSSFFAFAHISFLDIIPHDGVDVSGVG